MPSPFPHLALERRGRLDRFAFDADCLAGNPWNDPTRRDVLVYSPHGSRDDTKLPVVLFLPAFAGTGEGLLARGLTDVPLTTRLDHLFAGGAPPFRAVFPDTMTRLGGSQYVNSPAIGNYRTYVTEAIPHAVSARFACTSRWGVAGRSSGGYGALCLAMSHPERFGATVSHAGDLGFDLCFLGDIPGAIRALQRHPPTAFHEAFWAGHRPSGEMFAAFNLLAMACAYSPDVSADGFPARLPFDPSTGAIHHEVLDEWQAFDPLQLIEAKPHQDALRTQRLLFLDAGRSDEYSLQLGMQRFSQRLNDLDIPHQTDLFDGGHRGTAYRWDVSLPLLATAVQDLD
ncbi:MAG: alpha/beta hydrolase-fold protein [Myxococcota bacterium]